MNLERPRPRAEHWRDAGLLLAVLAAILALHGPALRGSLFLDDYAHYQQLKAADWSLRSLTDACRLELIGGVLETPWFEPCTLRFFRPIAFGLMKLAYTLSGWSPAALHAVSLAWHALNCGMLMMLMRRLGVPREAALAGTLLLALHPGHVGTVQWVASQSELMVTAFLLAATRCYVALRDVAPIRGSAAASGEISTAGRLRIAALAAACLAFFGLALGCRENAIVLPFVLALCELVRLFRPRGAPAPGLVAAQRGGLTRAALLLTACLLVGAGYVWLRHSLLGAGGIPPFPYVRTPADPGFWSFVFDKFCYYILGQFLLVPILPFGGVTYLRERPWILYGASGLLLLLILWLCWRNRRREIAWLAPGWLVLTMTPVLPAFESPHHLYLPGAGWAMLISLAYEALVGHRPPPPAAARGAAIARNVLDHSAAARSRAGRRLLLARLGLLLSAAVMGFLCLQFTRALEAARQVEDRVIDEVLASADGVRDGQTLYMLNMPLIAHYLGPALMQRSGARELRVVVLTWAPRVLGMTAPAEVEWLSPRVLRVQIAQQRYFSGALGELLRAARGEEAAQPGATHAFRGGRLRVLQADSAGIRVLEIEFEQPPAESGARLFWGSSQRWAFELHPPPQPR